VGESVIAEANSKSDKNPKNPEVKSGTPGIGLTKGLSKLKAVDNEINKTPKKRKQQEI